MKIGDMVYYWPTDAEMELHDGPNIVSDGPCAAKIVAVFPRDEFLLHVFARSTSVVNDYRVTAKVGSTAGCWSHR